MSDLDVAIVIVTFRSASLTVDCLHSVARDRVMTPARVRCVVVDNASGDAPDIARAIEDNDWGSWVRLIVAERNGGFAYGNNVGIRAAYEDGRPDYVHLLNPDTVVRAHAIGALLRFMQSRSDVGIAGGVFDNADNTEWAIAFRFPSLLGEAVYGLHWGLATRVLKRWEVPMHLGRSACPVDWVIGASMMIRRTVLDEIGGFDVGFFLYVEETEFCHRARRAGYAVWYVPESRVLHLAGQSTKVAERNVAPRRFPAYWFQSRVRYFVLTGNSTRAVLADSIALLTTWVGEVKRVLLRRPRSGIPLYLRDVFAHSLLRKKNREGADFSPNVPRL